MKTLVVFRGLFTVAALAVVTAIGCSDSTTHKDVAGARDKLQQEKQRTADTIHQGQQDIADAKQKAEEHTVAKPVTTDQPNKDQRNVADTQLKVEENVAKQKEKEREAAGNLADKEQQLRDTQSRDAFVKDVEAKLADTDKQIDGLKHKAANAKDAEKDALNRQVDLLKTQRDMAQKALNDLKSADLANWKNHQEHVQLALRDLDNSMRTIR